MKTNRPGGVSLTRAALAACGFRPGDRILDAGCGFGATVDLIDSFGGILGVGLDKDVSRLAQARDTGREQATGRFAAAALPRLPFRPGSFQGIFCECVLSLVPEKADCLAAFWDVLGPNGTLVLADLVLPEETGVGWNSKAAGDAGPAGAGAPVTCLDGALTLPALTAAMEQAGFKITAVEDHTRKLREMACEMVFEHGSLDRFWQVLTGTDCPEGLSGACRAGSLKPGYAMVTATKGE